MKTSILKKKDIAIEKGKLIITYKNEIADYVAIYGGIKEIGVNNFHIFYPLHTFRPQMENYRGMLKKHIVTSKEFRIESFNDRLKIEQEGSKEFTNSLLMIKDIDENDLYFAFCERLGSVEGKKALITPIKMIADIANLVGNQLWIDAKRCYAHYGILIMSN